MNILASVLVFTSVTLCIMVRFFDKKFFMVHALFGLLLIAYGSFELYSLLSMKTSIISRLRDSLHLNINWYAFFYLFIIYTGVSQIFKKRFKQAESSEYKQGWKNVSFVQHCSDSVYDVFGREAYIDLKDISLKNNQKICVHVTFGSAIVLVPSNVSVQFESEAKMGKITLPTPKNNENLDKNQLSITIHIRVVCGSVFVK